MKFKLQITHKNVDAKNQVLEALKDFTELRDLLYNKVKEIAEESEMPLDYLWDWALKQIIPDRNYLTQSQGFTARQPVLIETQTKPDPTPKEAITLETPVVEKEVGKLPTSNPQVVKQVKKEPTCEKLETPKEPVAKKVVIMPKKEPTNLVKETVTLPATIDELNFVGACEAKTLEGKIACLTKIKDIFYWRKLFGQTKSRKLKIYILSNSTDYELAERGLRSSDSDQRIAVMKMVYQHVQAGIKLWENRDSYGNLKEEKLTKH